MKRRVFIQGIGSVSCQDSAGKEWPSAAKHKLTEQLNPALHPDYKNELAGIATRRLSTGMKMSMVAAKRALEEAGLQQVDGIITGTGMGCMIESEKFLNNLIQNDEQFLTPTSFIQSTHNTVAGHLALTMGCKGYNATYVHGHSSFEAAVFDAHLHLKSGSAAELLVGGVDELSPIFGKLHQLTDHIDQGGCTSDSILESENPGCLMGEGAHFFVMCDQPSDSTISELIGVELKHRIDADHLALWMEDFLHRYDLVKEDIDVFISGVNGDKLSQGHFQTLDRLTSNDSSLIAYKHLSSEYPTASAYGYALAARVLQGGSIDPLYLINGNSPIEPKYALIYNQYRGLDHSLTLLKKC